MKMKAFHTHAMFLIVLVDLFPTLNSEDTNLINFCHHPAHLLYPRLSAALWFPQLASRTSASVLTLLVPSVCGTWQAFP